LPLIILYHLFYYLSRFYFLITPSPFIALPLKKGKGEWFMREASPLLNSPFLSLLQRRGRYFFQRGFAPLSPLVVFLLFKGQEENLVFRGDSTLHTSPNN